MKDKFSRQEVVTWEARLTRAYRTEDVLAIAKEFVAAWGPAELATLPEHLRPGRLRDSDDVGLYAFKLVSHPASGPNAGYLLRMTTFFTAASRRLSEIFAIAAAEARIRWDEHEDAASEDAPDR